MPLQVSISATARRPSTTNKIARMKRDRRLKSPSNDKGMVIQKTRNSSASSTSMSLSSRSSRSSSLPSGRPSAGDAALTTARLDAMMPVLRGITNTLIKVEDAYRLQLPAPVKGQLSSESRLNLLDIEAFNQWDRLKYDPHLQHQAFAARFQPAGIAEIKSAINARKRSSTRLSQRLCPASLDALESTQLLSESISSNIPDGPEHPANKFGSPDCTKLILIEQRLWKAWVSIVNMLNFDATDADGPTPMRTRRDSASSLKAKFSRRKGFSRAARLFA